MRAVGLLFFVVAAVLAVVPGWSGPERLALPHGDEIALDAEQVSLDPGDPARRRVGRLSYLGGVALTSADPAFGGFSALLVQGDAVTLLNDGGNVARFRIDPRGRVGAATYVPLPSGPGTGWRKRDRDSESLATDPRTGRLWIGFERANAIWRFAPGFVRAERAISPPEMKQWRDNGGPEAMTRLADGRFLVIAEERTRGIGREALLYPGDPTDGRPPVRFRYLPPDGFDPSDVAELPDGRIVVLNRWWGLPLRFRSALTLFDPARIRPGAVIRGEEIARIAPPLRTANFEGVARAREGGRTVLWLLSDNDGSRWTRTLLLKFRLD